MLPSSSRPIISIAECIDSRGTPISTALTGSMAEMTEPIVPPPFMSEWLENF